MTTRTREQPTPAEGTALILAFVNSHAGGQPELLGDACGLQSWLGSVGYGDDGVSEADAVAAREFRDALQLLMLAHSGDLDTATAERVESAEALLGRLAARYPVEVVVTADAVKLRPPGTGMPGAFAALLADVTELARKNAWHRLKACRNPICHEGFYDRSRNSSGIYHGPGCASMVSMRAFRDRKRDAGQDS